MSNNQPTYQIVRIHPTHPLFVSHTFNLDSVLDAELAWHLSRHDLDKACGQSASDSSPYTIALEPIHPGLAELVVDLQKDCDASDSDPVHRGADRDGCSKEVGSAIQVAYHYRP